MRHEIPGSWVEGLRFRPYEDVLGVGHRNGFSSLGRFTIHGMVPWMYQKLFFTWVICTMDDSDTWSRRAEF